ncbi:MAG TPA: hypothetical protein DDY77_01750 [Clostridiales bacterium]|nr:hypothetical protein [Clostridiales bacterium]
MLKNKIKTFSVLALVSVLAISLSLFGLSLDKPRGFVFAAEAETSSSGESTTEETAVAKIGEKTYSSLSAAVEAAEAGDTVTLVADTEDNVVVSKDLTIDLGDYTVSNASKGDSEVIKVTSGTLVLNANKGGVYGGSGANYVAICTISGSIVINGGNYSIGGDKNGLANPTVYIYGSGNVTINGGTFSSEKPYNGRYYVLNILNKKGNGTFVVTGGTFINCNPADGDDNLHGNFVAEGYVSVDNGDESYTVKKVIAKVGENSYASLAEAVAAAKDGDTVTLVADTAENVTINKSLKLDLGDYTLYSGAKDVVLTVKSGNVVINADKGGVRGGSGSNNVAIMVTEGNITINGGNYYVGGDANGDGNSTIYIAGSGNVTITGGNFETEKAWEKFYYVLNIQNDKTGTFVVTGGTFKNYNPAVGDDNKGGNFVAEGYNVLEDTTSPDYTKYEVINGVFKVTKVGGEKVGYYNTLEEAIEAAPEKGYIYLANDYTASASVYDLSGKVLRLNNYTLTCSEGTSFVGENAGITWGNVVGENGSYALIIGKEDYKTDNFKISVGNYCGIKIQNATNVTLDGCNIEAPAEYALSLGENVTVVVGGYNTSSFKTGAKGFFACEKGSKLTIENNVFLTGDGKFFVNLGGELVVSADAKKLLEEKFAEVVANYVFVTTETEGYYSVIEKSTLKEYLVNLGTSITLKVSVNEVGKNVKVTYAYGDDEVEIVKHTDGFYYIENITPQIIDRVYTVKVYEGETVVDSKELSVLGY